MKCLSVKQPWAELIACGKKSLEIRTWRTNYRGPLVILAGSIPKWDAMQHFGFDQLPLGVAICTAELLDVRPFVDRDSTSACCYPEPDKQEFAWVLANVRRCPRIPVKGQLGLFPPPRELGPMLISRGIVQL